MNLHKALIASEIFGDAGSGGGGSSDFSTATVTTIYAGEEPYRISVPNFYDGRMFSNIGLGDADEGAEILLYKGSVLCEFYTQAQNLTFSVSGNATKDHNFIVATGNFTVTITEN